MVEGTTTRSPTLEVADVAADLLDDADPLVAEDRCRDFMPGIVPADHVQVGAADGAGGEPDDRVGRLLDLRLGDVVEADVPDPVEDDGLHSPEVTAIVVRASRAVVFGGPAVIVDI